MLKPLDKILTNNIRLMVVSILVKVNSCDFNYLKKITNSTQGNLSIQLKKLAQIEYIIISKSFEKNYPKTSCSITKKGVKAFQEHFKALQSYKDLEI